MNAPYKISDHTEYPNTIAVQNFGSTYRRKSHEAKSITRFNNQGTNSASSHPIKLIVASETKIFQPRINHLKMKNESENSQIAKITQAIKARDNAGKIILSKIQSKLGKVVNVKASLSRCV